MAQTIGSLDLNAFSDLYSDSTQYFWFEGNASATYGAGVHVTLVPDTSFISNPTSQNILMNTDGISIRNGVLPMMTLDNDSLDFNIVDTTAGTYTNVASFGNTTTIGKSTGTSFNVGIEPSSIKFNKGTTQIGEINGTSAKFGGDTQGGVFELGKSFKITGSEYIDGDDPDYPPELRPTYGYQFVSFDTIQYSGNRFNAERLLSRMETSDGDGQSYIILGSGGGIEEIPEAELLIVTECHYLNLNYRHSLHMGADGVEIDGTNVNKLTNDSISIRTQSVNVTIAANSYTNPHVIVDCTPVSGYTARCVAGWYNTNQSDGRNSSFVNIYRLYVSESDQKIHIAARNTSKSEAKAIVNVLILYTRNQ